MAAAAPAPAPVPQKKKLQWYEWCWIGWPVLLIFAGGLLGGLCGGIALGINQQVFQKIDAPLVKYPLTLGISVLAVIAYVFGVVALMAALGK